jgi:hypothetical protein
MSWPIAFRASLVSVAVLAGAMACGSNSPTGTGGTGPDTTVASVSVNATVVTIAPGAIDSLTATAYNASDSVLSRGFTWVSGAAGVATVSQTGVVTAIIAGSATISANAGGKTGSVVITVSTGSGASHVFADISAGYDYTTCGRTTDGSSWCWGHNDAGQIGDGSTFNRTLPTRVSGSVTFAQLITGPSRTCGLSAAGAAYCWGSPLIGDSTQNARLVPTAVYGGLSFTHIAVGKAVICALTSSGAAYCWGGAGGTGDGTDNADRWAPVPVMGGLSFAEIATTGAFACARTSAGAGYCWGAGLNGELGDGTQAAERSTPTAMTGGLSFADIATADTHACGVTTGGAAYCWGDDSFGEGGDGTKRLYFTVPTPVAGGLHFTQLALGTNHTCGITTAGAAYCWGDNSFGQLGDGTTTARLTPTAVTGGLAFTKLVAGHVHTCGLVASGAAYCWGDNVFGELGDGTGNNRPVPTAVH